MYNRANTERSLANKHQEDQEKVCGTASLKFKATPRNVCQYESNHWFEPEARQPIAANSPKNEIILLGKNSLPTTRFHDVS